MDKAKFKGVFSALLTPYTTDDKINGKSVKQIIDFNLAKGINGFYVGGSTGEGMLLTVEERKQLFKYAAESNAGRGTMIAHVGTINTNHAIDMAKYAQDMGYDAISAVAPFYYGFSYEAIKGYYNDIANSVDIPMIMYNFPNANGFQFNKERAEDMFKNKKFIGIKHTTSDLFALQQFKTMECDPLVYNGFDEILVAGLSMGADGGIGSTYNFMPQKYVDMYRLFNEGDIKQAQKIQYEANEIITMLIKYGVFATEKGILEEMGIEMGGCRKPFTELSAEGKAYCKQLVKKL
ncbi:MAG: N-acetylneuraminate lyase [Clostridia bacterium]|nr:N-acetylneuraminate lyase [Clostridia bacterium]MDE6605551.1 N-acetylneuraminate lyase [Clostridia bacterium]